MQIKPEDQLIIKKLDEIPPIAWVSGKTPDQLHLFGEVQQAFQIIKAELHSYFSGEPSPASIAFPDRRTQVIYALASRRYLDLYSAIRSGWQEIQSKAAKLRIDLPESPGKCLSAIIENDCMAMLDPTSKYQEYRPRRLGNLYQMEAKIQSGRASEREIKRFQTNVKRLNSDLASHTGLLLFCLSVLGESRVSETRELLKRYDRTISDLDREVASGFHPRRADRGFTWVKGEKIYNT